jgi:hypothetical protein
MPSQSTAALDVNKEPSCVYQKGSGTREMLTPEMLWHQKTADTRNVLGHLCSHAISSSMPSEDLRVPVFYRVTPTFVTRKRMRLTAETSSDLSDDSEMDQV